MYGIVLSNLNFSWCYKVKTTMWAQRSQLPHIVKIINKQINCEVKNLIWLLLVHLQKTVSDSRLSGRGTTSTATEDQSDSVYVNIHTFPSSPPPATDVTPHNAIMVHTNEFLTSPLGAINHPQMLNKRTPSFSPQAPVSCEDEVTYSTVTIKPRNPPPPHHGDRALQGSG